MKKFEIIDWPVASSQPETDETSWIVSSFFKLFLLNFLSAKKLHLVWNTFNSLKHCSTLTQSSDLNPGFILYRNAKVSHQKHKAEKTLVLRKRDRMEGEWC